MRICIVTQYFWPESFRINDLAAALQERGHEVQVLTGRPNYPGGTIPQGYRGLRPMRSEYLKTEVLRAPLVPRGGGGALRLALNYVSFALSASLCAFAIRGPVDVVLVYEPSPLTVAVPGLTVGRRFRAPVAMWVQDLWPQTLQGTGVVRGRRTARAAGAIAGFLHRKMNALLVQSRAFNLLLIQQGVSAAAISYVPNWVEDWFQPVSAAADAPERSELPDGFIVMFAGNIGESQGLETVLEAAALVDLPDLHWVILGEGRHASAIRSEISRRKLENVHLLGSRPAESMPTWFSLADALLVTLKPEPVYEATIPSKVQAYLACGKPILAALSGIGASEVERAGAGLTCEAGDARGLARITKELYTTDLADREAMGRRGVSYSRKEYNREALVTRVEELLRGLVARERTRPDFDGSSASDQSCT